MEQILSGKALATAVKAAVSKLILEHDLKPRMSLIQIEGDPASDYYVDSIVKNSAKLGCSVSLSRLPKDTGQAELMKLLHEANNDPEIHGIMIQKPLPKGFDEMAVNLGIAPEKDIDSISPLNLGKIILEANGFLPCTPLAVYLLLRFYGIDPAGRNVVILGRSAVVGKPLANILLWKKDFANATVTVCHSKTKDLSSITKEADILISAIGIAGFVKAEMVKEGVILIDVGINESTTAEGKVVYVGDADYQSCSVKAAAITPVPGGIGTITTSLLYLNLVKAALDTKKLNKNIDDFIAVIFNAI